MFLCWEPPADLSRPLWALSGGGVAGGVGLALLLHLRSAFHHVVLQGARYHYSDWTLLWNQVVTWTLRSSCLVQHSDSYSVLKVKKGNFIFVRWLGLEVFDTCRFPPHDGRSLSQEARGKFSPEMDLCASYGAILPNLVWSHRFVESDLLVFDEAVLPEVFLAFFLLLGLILGDKCLMTP